MNGRDNQALGTQNRYADVRRGGFEDHVSYLDIPGLLALLLAYKYKTKLHMQGEKVPRHEGSSLKGLTSTVAAWIPYVGATQTYGTCYRCNYRRPGLLLPNKWIKISWMRKIAQKIIQTLITSSK